MYWGLGQPVELAVRVTVAPSCAKDTGLALREADLQTLTVEGVNVYLSTVVVALVPQGFVTWMFTVPGLCTGLVAVMLESELTVKAALEPPNTTELAPTKWIPVMATLVPPAVVPWVGDTLLMPGTPVE
jgi:hypothetical protein